MPNFSRNEVVLVRVVFSNQAGAKVRPAIVVSGPHPSHDILIVPLTSKVEALLPGEFVLAEWAKLGLNVVSAVKRGVYTIHENLVSKRLGNLALIDQQSLDQALRGWMNLT